MAIATVYSIPTAYTVLRAEPVPRLDGLLYDLIHQQTGARHVHLAVPERNNYFCALYRTPPDDSTGAPHIMEHCVSGGSRRFPPGAGGDMYTRSLLTDVNGMTHADFTTFYIATRNHGDLMNWIEYIVDVTLHPRMEKDTFLRHRGHFELDDASARVRFVGTVFNEMKATFASPARHASAAIRRALFPGHPYANDAGGDPVEMPTLTYEDILAFFRRFYHPANGVYISWGDVPLTEILAKVEEVVGEGAEPRPPSATPDVPLLDRPVVAEAPLPISDEGTGGQVVLGWVTGVAATDSYARLELDVAMDVLFEASAAPLLSALRSSGLVRGVVEAKTLNLRQAAVELTLTGADPNDAGRIDEVVADALSAVVRDGLDDRLVDDAIARIELRRRERADGLRVFLDAVTPAVVHGGDPFTAFELDGDLARLKRERGNGRPLEDLVRTHLLENTHRARVALVPDPGLERRRRDAEDRWLEDVASGLTDEDRAALVEQARRLGEPPKKDFPRRGLTPEQGLTELERPEGHTEATAGVPVDVFDVATDGIVYLGLRVDLRGLDDELVPYLGLFAAGLERRARAEASRADGISVTNRSATDPSGERCLHWLEVSARALSRDAAELPHVIGAALGGLEPDASLITETASVLEQGVMPNAQELLRRLAGGSLRRSAVIDDLINGLGQLRFLKGLARASTDDLADRFALLREELFVRARIGAFVAAGVPDATSVIGPLSDALDRLAQGTPPPSPSIDRIDGPRPHRARALQLPVAFTCAAYAIPGLAHADCPAVAVLGQLLWSGYLNAEVRKGGAYGVDIETLPNRGLFWISSRRDPLPDATYRAIGEGIARFAEGRWDGPGATEGMIAALRVTDPVDAPAQAARRAWIASATGNTTELWNDFRRRVLDVTDDDLTAVAQRRLRAASRATLIGRSMLDAGGSFDEVEDL